MYDKPASLLQVDVGPAADLPPGFFESVSAGTPPRASSSDSGGVLGVLRLELRAGCNSMHSQHLDLVIGSLRTAHPD